MLVRDPSEETSSLVVEKRPLQVVAYEDGESPLSLVLPPFEDLAEIESLKSAHFSIHEFESIASGAMFHDLAAAERKRLKRKVRRFGDSAILHNRLANLDAAVGDLESENLHLQRAIELDSHEFFRNRLVENLVARSLDDEAKTLLVGQDSAGSVFAQLHLAGILARQNDIAAAQDCVNAALEISPADYGARLFHGAINLWRANFGEAILSFRIALEARPSSAVAHTNMAIAYLAANRSDKAFHQVKLAVAIEPLNLNAVALLADIANNQDRDVDAIPALRFFTRFEQKSAGIWSRFARALLRIGQLSDTIASLKRQASLESNPAVWNNLGVAYSLAHERDKALESYKQSMMLAGSPRSYDYCLAARNATALFNEYAPPKTLLAFIEQTLTDDNVTIFASHRELSGMLVGRMRSLVKLHRFDEAARFGQKILEADSTALETQFKVAINLLAIYSMRMGGEVKALQVAERYSKLVIAPEKVDAVVRTQLINNIAFVFAENGQIDAAEQYLQLISNSIHKSPYPTATLGLLHLKKGNLDRAAQLYEEALRIAPTKDDKSRIRQKWNLELGKAILESEPKRAARLLAKASEEKDAEPGLAEQAAILLRRIAY